MNIVQAVLQPADLHHTTVVVLISPCCGKSGKRQVADAVNDRRGVNAVAASAQGISQSAAVAGDDNRGRTAAAVFALQGKHGAWYAAGVGPGFKELARGDGDGLFDGERRVVAV